LKALLVLQGVTQAMLVTVIDMCINISFQVFYTQGERKRIPQGLKHSHIGNLDE
jgi:hypothetical protein